MKAQFTAEGNGLQVVAESEFEGDFLHMLFQKASSFDPEKPYQMSYHQPGAELPFLMIAEKEKTPELDRFLKEAGQRK